MSCSQKATPSAAAPQCKCWPDHLLNWDIPVGPNSISTMCPTDSHSASSGVMPPPNAQLRWQRHRGPPIASEACQPWPLKSHRPLGLTAWPHYTRCNAPCQIPKISPMRSAGTSPDLNHGIVPAATMYLPEEGPRAPTNLGGSGVGSIPHPPSAVGSPQNPCFCFQPTFKGHNLIPKEHKWTV